MHSVAARNKVDACEAAAFGQEAAEGGVGVAQWCEEFFGGLYYRVLKNQRAEADSVAQARTIRKLLRVRKGARVLDVPCGMGRITVPLARMGLRMTGVDFEGRFIREARRRAAGEGLDVRFVKGDMHEIAFDGEFHAAFNWFTSFGYGSDDDDRIFLEKVFRALKPGGRFLLEHMNKSWLLSHFKESSDETVGGVRVENSRKWDGRSGRVVATWVLTRGAKTERHRLSIRIFNGAEMRKLLRSVGFRDIELLGGPSPGRFTRHSRRMIAVARRPRGR